MNSVLCDALQHLLKSLTLLAQVELMVHNDSVIALACGTGGPLHGCVLIVGTGRLLGLLKDADVPVCIICTNGISYEQERLMLTWQHCK